MPPSTGMLAVPVLAGSAALDKVCSHVGNETPVSRLFTFQNPDGSSGFDRSGSRLALSGLSQVNPCLRI